MIWYDGNSMLIRIADLKDQRGGDESSGTDVTTATISVQLKDLAGANVGSAFACTYVAGTDGDYEGIADKALGHVVNQEYVAEVTVTDGPGRDAFWTEPVYVVDRTTP